VVDWVGMEMDEVPVLRVPSPQKRDGKGKEWAVERRCGRCAMVRRGGKDRKK
jgi:hypothetical protein